MPRPRKLPSRERVVELYVQENMSTSQIAAMFGVTDPHTVRTQLLRAGVKLRRHTTPKVCKVKDCGKPVKKITHGGNKSVYGTMCAEHRAAHYLKLNNTARIKRQAVERFEDEKEREEWISARTKLMELRRLVRPRTHR